MNRITVMNSISETADTPATITLDMMRESFYSAVLCDALDSLGYTNQSPRLQLKAMTGIDLLVGRCKTMLWADMAHEDERPYELELQAVDGCKADDVMIVAASGSMRSGIWGELLSGASRNAGCVGVIADGAVRDVRQMTNMQFPVFALGACIYDSRDRQRVIDIDVPVEIDGVCFHPGDLVVADVDGVVVCPREIEDKAVACAWQKVHAENVVRDEIVNGVRATDVFRKYGVL
jgi:4-hydroxy-4-methyl-2-oxoglutarate aldolase